jgi:enoyl-[acyl-carrier protein] reductase I
MGLLSGKKAFIFGVANDTLDRLGYRPGASTPKAPSWDLTSLGEALEKRVRPLAESVNASLILPCDVSKDSEIEALYKEVEKKWGKFDILMVHCIAFANRDDLKGAFTNTSRAGFRPGPGHLGLQPDRHLRKPAVPLLNRLAPASSP